MYSLAIIRSIKTTRKERMMLVVYFKYLCFGSVDARIFS